MKESVRDELEKKRCDLYEKRCFFDSMIRVGGSLRVRGDGSFVWDVKRLGDREA